MEFPRQASPALHGLIFDAIGGSALLVYVSTTC
jgi:hypothetical protein